MRIAVVSVPAALFALTLSTALLAQKADSQIDARSVALVQQGRAAQAAGNFDGASDAFESALAVDPRNRQAFIAIAELSKATGLPGKAIRFYREALLLEPNDAAVLRGQGEAMVAKGAVEKAKANLAKIQTICAKGCSDATALAAAIAKGPPVTTAVAEAPEAKAPEAKGTEKP